MCRTLYGGTETDATRHRSSTQIISTPLTRVAMTQDVDGFKATAQEILCADMSDGAKLAAIAELMGAASAEDIAKALNKSPRTVERHYAELRKVRKSAGTQICGTTQKCVPEVRKSADSDPQICVVASHAPASITTRATNELPSEVTLYEDIITPLIAPQPLKTKPAKRGSRLPDDWQLPDDWRDWTAVNCPASTPDRIDREALIFANYWQALPGAKACKTDWKKTWQNWCLKSFGTAPTRPTSTGVFLSAAERQRQREREGRALLDSICAGAVQ